MKYYLMAISAILILEFQACKKKSTTDKTVIYTAEQIAGQYLWADYQSDAGHSGTFTSLFTSCEACNLNDTVKLELNGSSSISEEGAACGICTYAMVFNSPNWSISDKNKLNINKTWTITTYKDSILEITSGTTSGALYKAILRKVNPQPPPLITVTIDMMAGKYLWEDFSKDGSRTGAFISQFSSCETCNQHDTVNLVKGAGCSIIEAGTPCGTCSYSIVMSASNWSIAGSSTLNFDGDMKRNWVVTKFNGGVLELKNDNGGINAIYKIRLNKIP